MSIPKEHHYVPRSFFKPWANHVQELIVYERKNGIVLPPYRQFTKSICVQAGLYSYNRIFLASSKPESLEHFLARSPTDAIRHMNALTVQQAKSKAFSNNRNHALRFLQNRLGKHHGILPWASID